MEKTFGIVVNFITGEWGYEVYENGEYVETVHDCDSYEDAYDKAKAKGYRFECEEA